MTSAPAPRRGWRTRADLSGRTIDRRYELLERIGSGGMADVYRACGVHHGHELALKLLDPDLAQDADEVHRFRLEYRALYQLSHPASELDAAASGVVRAEDLGFVDGRPYYTMELLRGETLSARIQRARLGPLEVVTLGEALAGILERMHRRGVIHRDLKPNNIFLVDDDLTRVKILDLGVAKLSPTFYSTTWRYQTPASQRLQTRPGVVVGHPEYMAPERLTEGSSSDPRVDIYSLGALLYEALTGSPRVRREQTPMGFPRELVGILTTAMAPDPGDRFDSMAELREELHYLRLELLAEESEDAVDRRERDGVAKPRSARLLTLTGVSSFVGGVVFASMLAAPSWTNHDVEDASPATELSSATPRVVEVEADEEDREDLPDHEIPMLLTCEPGEAETAASDVAEPEEPIAAPDAIKRPAKIRPPRRVPAGFRAELRDRLKTCVRGSGEPLRVHVEVDLRGRAKIEIADASAGLRRCVDRVAATIEVHDVDRPFADDFTVQP